MFVCVWGGGGIEGVILAQEGITIPYPKDLSNKYTNNTFNMNIY